MYDLEQRRKESGNVYRSAMAHRLHEEQSPDDVSLEIVDGTKKQTSGYFQLRTNFYLYIGASSLKTPFEPHSHCQNHRMQSVAVQWQIMREVKENWFAKTAGIRLNQ